MRTAAFKAGKSIDLRQPGGSGMQLLPSMPMANRRRQMHSAIPSPAENQPKTDSRVHRCPALAMSFRSIGFSVFLTLTLLFVAGSFAQASVLPENLPILDDFKAGLGKPIGLVQRVKGEAVVMHADVFEGYRLREGLLLYKGDTLMTLEKGRVRIKLNDGSLLSQSSNTNITLNKSVYDRNKKTRSSFLGMALGKARFLVSKLFSFKRSEFKVKTPTAVCGVRGSDFALEVTADVTRATAFENTEIELISLVDPEAPPVVLTDFMTSSVFRDKLPTVPERLPEIEIERIKQQFIGMQAAAAVPPGEDASTERTFKKSATTVEAGDEEAAAAEKVVMPITETEMAAEPVREDNAFDQAPVFVSEADAGDIGGDTGSFPTVEIDDAPPEVDFTEDLTESDQPLDEQETKETIDETKDEVKEEQLTMPDFPNTPE